MNIFDSHQDLLLHIEHPEYFKGDQQTGWELLELAEVKSLIATAFPVPEAGDWFDVNLNDKITADFDKYNLEADTRENWIVVKTINDLESKKHKLILHIEGLNTIKDTLEDWEQLNIWYEKGWRSLGIVWNKSNLLGGGTENIEDTLTSFGEKIIRWCIEKGIIIDCAHMNRKTFSSTSSILREFKKPIFVSHGNADVICSSERNYTDKQIMEIADSNGVIGVFFSGSYVSKTKNDNNLEKVISHIEHIRSVGGDDVVAIGSDFGGITKGVPKGLENVTKIQNLLQQLRKKEWTDEQCEKFAYKNAERVIKNYLN